MRRGDICPGEQFAGLGGINQEFRLKFRVYIEVLI